MAFNGTEGAPITLATAATWTANYRSTIAPTETRAHFFGRDILEKILTQEDCMGIRIYYALNDAGEKQLILVGADTQENDQTSGTIADFSNPCPPFCPTNASPLNS